MSAPTPDAGLPKFDEYDAMQQAVAKVPSLVLLDITEATADVLTAARKWASWPYQDEYLTVLDMRLRDAIDRFNDATHESDARLEGAS